MNLTNIDLNLLVYFDTLLRERNVTRAAQHLGISQPAMSNGLRRLRKLFNDPLLVRTSNGMMPTEKAMDLQPRVHRVLVNIEMFVQPTHNFNAKNSSRLFRIAASDYAEATLLPLVRERIAELAPYVSLDILTPSDINFSDVEQGNVDLVINRFDDIPQSLHLSVLWTDTFSCVMHKENPAAKDFDLEKYVHANHIWVSKTGMGVGTGINPNDVLRLGWVDLALAELSHRRRISVFTRHYATAIQYAQQKDLVATVATRVTHLAENFDDLVVYPAPFPIPEMELQMIWSSLLHHNASHEWLRNLVKEAAKEV